MNRGAREIPRSDSPRALPGSGSPRSWQSSQLKVYQLMHDGEFHPPAWGERRRQPSRTVEILRVLGQSLRLGGCDKEGQHGENAASQYDHFASNGGLRTRPSRLVQLWNPQMHHANG